MQNAWRRRKRRRRLTLGVGMDERDKDERKMRLTQDDWERSSMTEGEGGGDFPRICGGQEEQEKGKRKRKTHLRGQVIIQSQSQAVGTDGKHVKQ